MWTIMSRICVSKHDKKAAFAVAQSNLLDEALANTDGSYKSISRAERGSPQREALHDELTGHHNGWRRLRSFTIHCQRCQDANNQMTRLQKLSSSHRPSGQRIHVSS